MVGTQIAELAKQQLTELTGLQPDTVSSMCQDEEGWHVNVDLIQLRRIPDASDVLATYATVLDAQGNLLRYQRTRRYLRSEVADEP